MTTETKKWCPFTKRKMVDLGLNRGDVLHPDSSCIKSACMAWRLVDTHGVTPVDPTKGYCSLCRR